MLRSLLLVAMLSGCSAEVPEECRAALKEVDATTGRWPEFLVESSTSGRIASYGDSLYVSSTAGTVRLNKACPFVVQQTANDGLLLGADAAAMYLTDLEVERHGRVFRMARSASEATIVGALGPPYVAAAYGNSLGGSAVGDTELFFFRAGVGQPLYGMQKYDGALRAVATPSTGGCQAVSLLGGAAWLGCGSELLRVDLATGTTDKVGDRADGGFFQGGPSKLFFETTVDGTRHLATLDAAGTSTDRVSSRFEPALVVGADVVGIGNAEGVSAVVRFEANSSFTQLAVPEEGESLAAADEHAIFFLSRVADSCLSWRVINPMEQARVCERSLLRLRFRTVTTP